MTKGCGERWKRATDEVDESATVDKGSSRPCDASLKRLAKRCYEAFKSRLTSPKHLLKTLIPSMMNYTERYSKPWPTNLTNWSIRDVA